MVSKHIHALFAAIAAANITGTDMKRFAADVRPIFNHYQPPFFVNNRIRIKNRPKKIVKNLTTFQGRFYRDTTLFSPSCRQLGLANRLFD
jgi:hypothetical protein